MIGIAALVIGYGVYVGSGSIVWAGIAAAWVVVVARWIIPAASGRM
jgi:hypothetical protein